MAAFNRPTEATYEVHENITVDTSGKFFSEKRGEEGDPDSVCGPLL